MLSKQNGFPRRTPAPLKVSRGCHGEVFLRGGPPFDARHSLVFAASFRRKEMLTFQQKVNFIYVLCRHYTLRFHGDGYIPTLRK